MKKDYTENWKSVQNRDMQTRKENKKMNEDKKLKESVKGNL